MRSLSEFPNTARRNAGRYDWGHIFNGSVWELVRDKDFTTKPGSFTATVQIAARRRGITVKVGVQGNSVFIQALVTPGDEIPATIPVSRQAANAAR